MNDHPCPKLCTDFTKMGQPIMSRTYEVLAEFSETGEAPWELRPVPARVVAKFFGLGGSQDLIAVGLEWPTGTRESVNWPQAAKDFLAHPDFEAFP